MSKQEPAGIYIIRCVANRACYVGKAKHLFPRLHQHRHKLINGNHEIPLLQRDWDRFGQTQFEFSYLSLNPERLIAWEEFTIMLTDALETEGGYNRMLGQKEWSLSVRIRKSERKLVKAGKFWRLPSIWPEERINKTYCDTFCQKYQPIANLHRCQPIVPHTALKDPILKRELQRLLLGEFKSFSFEGKRSRSPTVTR